MNMKVPMKTKPPVLLRVGIVREEFKMVHSCAGYMRYLYGPRKDVQSAKMLCRMMYMLGIPGLVS
jgi:hypothetical protein